MNASLDPALVGRDRYRLRLLGLCLCLFAGAVVLYWPSLGNDFVWDAEYLYKEDPAIRGLAQLSTVLTTASNTQIESQGQQPATLQYYRPLSKSFNILMHTWFGDQPVGYKAVSIGLHGLVSVLVLLLLLSFRAPPTIALLATVLYLVQPTHTEAVAWTYSVSYLLTAVFVLAALLLYRHQRPVASLVAFALALLSHEMGIMLLPTLFLHRGLVERKTRPRDFIALLPFVAVTAVYLVARVAVVGSVPVSDTDPLILANTIAIITQRYLRMFVWPDAPVTIYLQQEFAGFTAELLVSYLLVAGLLLLAVILWRKDRADLFWLLWFGLWIAVSFNVGKLGDYLMAEKLLYIAAIGLCYLTAQWTFRLLRPRAAIAALLLASFAVVNAAQTWNRLPYWQDTATFVAAALEHEPRFYLAHYALADQYIRKQQFDRAAVHLEEAVRYNPGFSLALNNLANIRYLQGELPAAISSWRQALQADPTNPMPYFNIGLALRRLGQTGEADRHLRQYLKLEPNPPPEALGVLRSVR
ncbi:MAG: tetratricopeptide repeat protein [Gammaproteobacteria bacterium]|nr:tetratricopeptide repeat protein [Gammaproteobacteria bacterium]